jgi:hypothetical protein
METRRTKAPNKSSLTIPVGDFFISTLRTHSLLTMNKTKKRAYKRANKDVYTKNFWEGYYALTTRIKRVKYVRACIGLSLSEALDFAKRHPFLTPDPFKETSRRPQPSRPSWDSAPLVPDPDDILF